MFNKKNYSLGKFVQHHVDSLIIMPTVGFYSSADTDDSDADSEKALPYSSEETQHHYSNSFTEELESNSFTEGLESNSEFELTVEEEQQPVRTT